MDADGWVDQFGSDMPKLLLVGVVERTCLKTIVREIPGIKDCFRMHEQSKDGTTMVCTAPSR